MSRITRAERVQALLFLLIGIVVTASVVLMLLGPSFSKEEKQYYLQFTEAVTGLTPGSPVRYKGVKYGKISDIRVMPDNPEIVRVTLMVAPDAPIRVSTTAVIATQSILGPYHIELLGSRASSPPLPEESYIPASATTLAKLLTTGETLGDQLVVVLENLKDWTRKENGERLFKAVDEVQASMRTARITLQELRPQANGVMKEAIQVMQEVSAVMRRTEPTFQELLGNLNGSAKDLRAFTQAGGLSQLSETMQAALDRAVTEFARDGAAVRSWLAENNISPFMERAATSLEKLQTEVTALGRRIEAKGSSTLRDDIAPALRDLRTLSDALTRVARLAERQPRAFIFGEPRAEKPLPGVKKRP